jgi:RNA-dependent RNA polymerase
MILEDRGVRPEAFMALQETAIAQARTIDDSIEQFRTILRDHSLGKGYHLDSTLGKLESIGLDLKYIHGRQPIDEPFLTRVRRSAMNHVLRDVKHSARIPVRNSWLLVGVADEGPAYVAEGKENVFCLSAGKIYGAPWAEPGLTRQWPTPL